VTITEIGPNSLFGTLAEPRARPSARQPTAVAMGA